MKVICKVTVLILVGLSVLVPRPCCTQGTDEAERFQRLVRLSAENPPVTYLQGVTFSDLEQLEKDRKWLEGQKNEGNDFLFKVGQLFANKHPIVHDDVASWDQQLAMGVNFREYASQQPDSVWVYMALSDLFFTNVADNLQGMIDNEEWEVEDEPANRLIETLAENDYHIDIPVSNLEKLKKHLCEGDVRYIWHKAKTTYRKEAIIIMSIFVGCLFVVWGLWKRRKARANV